MRVEAAEGVTWKDRTVHAMAHVFDSLVDLAAIAALAYLAIYADPSAQYVTEVAGLIAAVAGVKRYLDTKQGGGGGG